MNDSRNATILSRARQVIEAAQGDETGPLYASLAHAHAEEIARELLRLAEFKKNVETADARFTEWMKKTFPNDIKPDFPLLAVEYGAQGAELRYAAALDERDAEIARLRDEVERLKALKIVHGECKPCDECATCDCAATSAHQLQLEISAAREALEEGKKTEAYWKDSSGKAMNRFTEMLDAALTRIDGFLGNK